MEKYIVDRIEENLVILQNKTGENKEIPISELPEANEGDVVAFENGKFTFDKEETDMRKKIIAEKLSKLFEKK